MEYVKGDLIDLTLEGKFDVITHGCNCFCRMGSGIAVPMKKIFGCDKFDMEDYEYEKDYNKLGTVDYETRYIDTKNKISFEEYWDAESQDNIHELIVVNSYTQYAPGQATPPYKTPLDYDALMMCFRKINHMFAGKHLGIPQIGSGLAGGNWDEIEHIIDEETPNINVTCVIYNK